MPSRRIEIGPDALVLRQKQHGFAVDHFQQHPGFRRKIPMAQDIVIFANGELTMTIAKGKRPTREQAVTRRRIEAADSSAIDGHSDSLPEPPISGKLGHSCKGTAIAIGLCQPVDEAVYKPTRLPYLREDIKTVGNGTFRRPKSRSFPVFIIA